MVVFSPATYADRAAAAPQAVDTSDNAAATDADDADLVPATIVGQLRNGLGQCLTSQDPKGSNGTPVANSNCAGKEIVAYSISMCPNLAQQQEMLQMLMDAKPAGVEPILHSDMGWQYQHETYISTLADNGFIQSMSRKGTCIDNGATEQVFGHLKDEFFRGQDWPTFESFKADLATYITYWNTTRRQVKLKGLTRQNTGIRPYGSRITATIKRVQVSGRSSHLTPGLLCRPQKFTLRTTASDSVKTRPARKFASTGAPKLSAWNQSSASSTMKFAVLPTSMP